MLALAASVGVSMLIEISLVEPESARERCLFRQELVQNFSVSSWSQHHCTVRL
jgi:hypothetical protein